MLLCARCCSADQLLKTARASLENGQHPSREGEALKSSAALRAMLLRLVARCCELFVSLFLGGGQTPTPERLAPVKTPHLVTPEPTNTRNTSAGG